MEQITVGTNLYSGTAHLFMYSWSGAVFMVWSKPLKGIDNNIWGVYFSSCVAQPGHPAPSGWSETPSASQTEHQWPTSLMPLWLDGTKSPQPGSEILWTAEKKTHESGDCYGKISSAHGFEITCCCYVWNNPGVQNPPDSKRVFR